MLVWRVRTSEMDTPGALVAGSGIKEVIAKGKLCTSTDYIYDFNFSRAYTFRKPLHACCRKCDIYVMHYVL